MGLLPSPRGNIKTVNTALFVMPERYDDKFLHTARFVISIDGLPWGLAVDSVNQPTRLQPDAVKWRSNRSKRPWLAGTVKSAMCALIDIPQMGKLLLDSEK
jgi:purine-binding chemotaxis protein CheW